MTTQREIDIAKADGKITAAECYELARKSWMPAAAADALVRAARTIELGEDIATVLANSLVEARRAA